MLNNLYSRLVLLVMSIAMFGCSSMMVPPYVIAYDFYLHEDIDKPLKNNLVRQVAGVLEPLGFIVSDSYEMDSFQLYLNSENLSDENKMIEGSGSKIVVSVRIDEGRISLVINDRLSEIETDYFRSVRDYVESVLKSNYKVRRMIVRQEKSWFT